jgi:hypothetical protein
VVRGTYNYDLSQRYESRIRIACDVIIFCTRGFRQRQIRFVFTSIGRISRNAKGERRNRNDIHVNLAVMKMGLKKMSTMLIPWHYDDIVMDDVT